MSEAAELYERDFYAWTQAQASALRAWRPGENRPNALDAANVAEEIEELGASQRNAVAGLMQQVVVHLLKLRFHPEQAARRHWLNEVIAFRDQLDRLLAGSPSLRARRADLAADVWARAERQFRRQLAADGHDARAILAGRLPADAPPFDLDREVLDPDWFPDGPAA